MKVKDNNLMECFSLAMFFVIFIFALPIGAISNSLPIPIYLEEMLNAGRNVYDKQSTPTQRSGVPTTLNLSMYIEGLSSFRTQTMDFQLDIYMQQFWTDIRLRHNESKRILIRDKEVLQKMWTPDIYFANARIAEFHEVTQPNFLLWLNEDGSILYDTRVSMVVMCTMDLAKWPLDSQRCHLRILSYAYDVNQLLIKWNLIDPITRNGAITLSDMEIVALVPGLCDGNYSTGEWSCVTAEFFVQRKITHHIMQSYVPTSLIVIISWFSFWLDVEAVPARVSLAITTLLTLSTQASTARMALPEVSYAKAIDVWSSTCMLFVFGVMIEFTITNFVQRQAMNQLQNGTDPGMKRRKSYVQSKESSDTPTQNIGVRAKSLIDRAMGRGGEHRHLIETSVDEYGTPEGTERRQPSDNKAFENDAPETATPPRTKPKISFENGKGSSGKSHNNSIKTAYDDRWREREAERLANWARVSVEPITEPKVTVGQGLWNRLKTQSIAANADDAENSQKVHDSNLAKSKLSGIGEKWTTALKQMQRNKKNQARHEAKKIDQFSRWSFPLAFIIFNLTYWTYYLYIA